MTTNVNFHFKRKTYIIHVLFIALFIACFINNTVGQIKYSFIANDSIKYNFEYVGTQFNFSKKTYIPSKNLINVHLTDAQEAFARKISANQWMTLLADTASDWAANLLLYYLHEKDAIQYRVNIKNREDWILLNQKKKEIRYWRKLLSSHIIK